MGRKDDILAAIALDRFLHPQVIIEIAPDSVSERLAEYAFLNPSFAINQASVNQEGALSYSINSGSVAQLVEMGIYALDLSALTGSFIIELIDLHGSIPTYKNQYETYPAHTDIYYTTPQSFDSTTNMLAWLNSDFVIEQGLGDTWRIITGPNGHPWLFYPNPEHFRRGAIPIVISLYREYNETQYNPNEYD